MQQLMRMSEPLWQQKIRANKPHFLLPFLVAALWVLPLQLLALLVLAFCFIFLLARADFAILITSFGLGASLVAFFARVGGGIYTKSADVGADLVGKIEAGIPEDDPRNPAVIADNVGDCVGDTAGMGADIYESYVGAMIASIILGIETYGTNLAYITFPVMLAALGMFGSVVGLAF